jgi:hypothetical protein
MATTYNFLPTSRYYGIPTNSMTLPDGTNVVYLERRFLPDPSLFSLLQLVTVSEGQRLDNIAATYLGDPTAFWRIADANSAMQPWALTETVGSVLMITLPLGVPGTPNA